QSVRAAPQSPGLEFAQAIADLHAGQKRLAKDPPWLVAAARHRGDSREFCLRVLGTVSAAERPDKADHLAAKLESALRQRTEYHLRQEGITGNEKVSARSQDARGQPGPFDEENAQGFALLLIERR